MASKGEDVVHAHLAAPIVAGSVLEGKLYPLVYRLRPARTC
jgi:hypothetical protein